MGDVIIDVPGGSNNHNYANVTLIVELARLHGVQAVWAGWGHASENPALPNSLASSTPPIKFIGPAGPPMQALGDKIGSTIIAQSAGVPCIGWNGHTSLALACLWRSALGIAHRVAENISNVETMSLRARSEPSEAKGRGKLKVERIGCGGCGEWSDQWRVGGGW